MANKDNESFDVVDNVVGLDVDICDVGIVVIILDIRYLGIEIGDLNEDVLERLNMS